MPPVRPLAPLPTRSASSTSTFFFAASLASHAAAESPAKPPPTMAKSTCSGSGVGVLRNVIFHGVSPQFCFLFVIALVRCRGSLLGLRGAFLKLSRKIGMREGRVKQSSVAIIQQHRGAGSTACPLQDPVAAAAIAANPRSSRQSRFPKYRSPAGQTLRNGKRNAHTRVKPLRYIQSKSGSRLSPLFS